MKINGREIAERIYEEIRTKAALRKKRVLFLVFKDDPSIRSFVSVKMKVAEKLGIEAEEKRYERDTTEQIVSVVEEANASRVEGIVVQLPLSAGIDSKKVLDAVLPELDIDVLGTKAKEDFQNGKNSHMPPVAFAVKTILEMHNIALAEKQIVLLGRGRLVGEPVARWLDREHVPYEVFDHTSDENKKLDALKKADIIISGIGMPHFLQPEMIKEGVVLIDAGTSEDSGVLKGDIDPACEEKASLVTPVPGGLGPLTVAGLFNNLFLE